MKVLIISEGDDVGGVAVAIQRAFERHAPDWTVWAMRGSNNYIDYANDYRWEPATFLDLWAKADVVHSMEKLHNLTPHFNPPGKPLVLHHHGTIYRDLGQNFVDICRDHHIPQVCSTIDLTLRDSAVEWLPNPAPVDWFAQFRSQYHPSIQELVTVGHGPTQRWAKHTTAFIDQFELANRQYKMNLLLTEGKNWVSSLADKAKCHIYFDQLAYGYGLSGIEAWSMGLPVIGGTEDDVVRAKLLETIGWLPYVETTMPNMAQTILDLALNPAAMTAAGERGQDYVNQYHDERRVVERLKLLWQKTYDEYEMEVDPWR